MEPIALDLSYQLLQPEASLLPIRLSQEESHERPNLLHLPWCHYLGNFIVVILDLAFAVDHPLKVSYYSYLL